MEQYIHRVQYYETDRMGITHHSNYIRWMEEARVDYLDKIGYGYKRLEDEGIISPVIGVECEYKSPTTFDDTVAITVDVEEFKGVKLILKYTMVNAADGKTVALGRSKHCFTDESGRPVALKKTTPKLDAKLKELAELS
ncbi:MAG: acyl-CoA thioesterase [Lachnospiraceae bacterium]|nr:acyl-CoA thioesterase [Lachnospiraceae bacterium]